MNGLGGGGGGREGGRDGNRLFYLYVGGTTKFNAAALKIFVSFLLCETLKILKVCTLIKPSEEPLRR